VVTVVKTITVTELMGINIAAIKGLIGNAKKGDIVLFSPAFASFGMFQNEYERNDQFVKIIKSLK
jgi:UDP-N-acetylmuramoylalanine--D-glutamate ligase